jgi:type IV pilus biogenesis protein CpaD/CtpE
MHRCTKVSVAPRRTVLLMAIAASLAACSQEPEYSDQQRACIAQHYKEFDARKLNQCVDVCKACMNGNNVTCNTSCKLRGAS